MYVSFKVEEVNMISNINNDGRKRYKAEYSVELNCNHLFSFIAAAYKSASKRSKNF